MSEITELARRVERTEARQAIGELPARYALAVDARDIEAWVNLFVEDVDCGRRGTGRDALRSFIVPSVRTFYRSIHQICGHTVDFIDDDHATGTVYCRAEHEDGDQWVVMAIIYFDRYVRRDRQWYFETRHEKHWYSADVLERPAPPFQLWKTWASRLPELPGDFPTWRPFWEGMDQDVLSALTRRP
ncbi:nuclear transport factor 2 family protein [Novosphingobium ginsenosidimutans]|uniref:Nuclear transport factor 2 family protein n=1 Tax=Novosphingobium ginsenosidimutans TaxID=1176536 RepID=A0A5B8S6I1_9SPHN|nr:nuclear transport factor 2 family protein [Novosphingobium ginsenosidimutans]QEA17033.1 nuclear transport factor 2 family protein [Novosphingobium ginsenosidimutans]